MKLRLGDVVFDPDTRQLIRGGGEVHVSPKAFELLRVLVVERPRALSKSELHERLWPRTFVSDANLASLVAELREALNDNARMPRFIRTAHRFGYAFCGEATAEARTDSGIDAASFCWLVSEGRRFPLSPGENVLGRDEGAVQIDSPTVSRRHARLSVQGTEAFIEDLGSKNGTFVRGTPVTGRIELSDGDEIGIGSVVLRFRMTLPRGKTATWSGPR